MAITKRSIRQSSRLRSRSRSRCSPAGSSAWTPGPTQTPAIIAAMAEKIRATDTKDVKVHTMLDSYPFAFYEDNTLFGKMTGYSWFSSGGARKAGQRRLCRPVSGLLP